MLRTYRHTIRNENIADFARILFSRKKEIGINQNTLILETIDYTLHFNEFSSITFNNNKYRTDKNPSSFNWTTFECLCARESSFVLDLEEPTVVCWRNFPSFCKKTEEKRAISTYILRCKSRENIDSCLYTSVCSGH